MTERTQELASRWKRFQGAVLDGLIATAAIIPIMLVGGLFNQAMEGQDMTTKEQVILFVVSLLLFFLINGYMLATSGQTVGKKLVGTRIVSNEDGRIIDFSRVAGLRYLPFIVIAQIPVLGFLVSLVDILFIFGADKRCVHDLVASTKVVNA